MVHDPMSGDNPPTLGGPFAAHEARLRGDIEFLVEWLSSPEPMNRVSAARELGKLRDRRAVPALVRSLQRADANVMVRYLGSEAPVVKMAALQALAKIGDPGSADAVFDVAQEEADPFEARWTAAETLLSLGDRRGVTMLAALLNSVPGEHRSWFATRALALIREAKGTEALPALRAARPALGWRDRLRLDRTIRALERVENRDRSAK
jgi:HEAT repeat protein